MKTLLRVLILSGLLAGAAMAQTTHTLVVNQVISAPVTSPAVTLNGNLAGATVNISLTIPASTSLTIITEVSADGGTTWSPLSSDGFANPATPKTTLFGEIFTLPVTIGWQVRLRVPAISGAVTVNSITVTQ